jgi:hypothetical protein
MYKKWGRRPFSYLPSGRAVEPDHIAYASQEVVGQSGRHPQGSDVLQQRVPIQKPREQLVDVIVRHGYATAQPPKENA